MRTTCVNQILGACTEREDIFVISGDAGLGVFDEFKEKFPDRFLNLGVAEQNTISFAAGLSLSGFKVYVYNIIPFLLYRCYEQVRNDICYQRLPVTLVGIGSGVTYAPQGMTHYAVEDLGIARTLPNLTVFSPCDPIEAKLAAEFSLGCREPVYIRIAKKGEPKVHANEYFDIRVPQVIEDGKDVCILFHGSIASEAFKARALLARRGIHAKLVSIPMIQPLPANELFDLLIDMKYVFTVEEHFVNIGMGNALRNEVARRAPAWRLYNLGISDKFIHEVKDLDAMRDYFWLSAPKIAEYIENFLSAG